MEKIEILHTNCIFLNKAKLIRLLNLCKIVIMTYLVGRGSIYFHDFYNDFCKN